MYALNTFLRLVRFVANSIVGIILGFVLGVLYQAGRISEVFEFLTG